MLRTLLPWSETYTWPCSFWNWASRSCWRWTWWILWRSVAWKLTHTGCRKCWAFQSFQFQQEKESAWMCCFTQRHITKTAKTRSAWFITTNTSQSTDTTTIQNMRWFIAMPLRTRLTLLWRNWNGSIQTWRIIGGTQLSCWSRIRKSPNAIRWASRM